MPETITIGSWEFAPDTGILSRDGETVRLESRTAALLEILCRRAGQLISQSDIIEQVWDGRAVSPNSVAVVISDIRRALGDDPRAPQYVETLPKRGYRLIADVSPMPDPDPAGEDSAPAIAGLARRRWPALAALAAVAMVLAGVFLFPGLAAPPETGKRRPAQISLLPVENQTSDAQYGALAISLTELLTYELSRGKSVEILPEGQAAISMRASLILWDGHPALSMQATSEADGRVVWSGMARGPEAQLPHQVRSEMSDFARRAFESPSQAAGGDADP